jgi:hypothetical protein
MVSQQGVDPDLWGHIQYGEDWLAEGALPRVASHTYAAEGYRWINHENLSELALAFGHRAVGGLGLMIGKAVLGVLMLLSMIYMAAKKGVNPVLAAASMLIVSLGLIEFWYARPQLASFLSMAAVVVVLESAFRSDKPVSFRRLLLLFPILVVWTNAHGGFVAGVCIVSAYLGLKALTELQRHGKTAIPIAAKLGAVIVGCGLCTLLNPYGPELLLWLLKSLGDPRPEITEWASILNSRSAAVPFTALTMLTVVCFWFSTEKKDPAHFVTIGLVAAQTFLNCRHVVFLAILVGYWMPIHIQSVWLRLKALSPEQPERRQPTAALAIPLVAVALLFGGLLVHKFSQFGVDRAEYPVDALQYMADNNLDGRIVVTFNWAQYTLAAKPNSTVGFDGRFRTCYPQSVVDMNFDLTLGDIPGKRHRAAESGPIDPTRVLNHKQPDFVLIDRNRDGPASYVMANQTDWNLLYQDKMCQLWSRTELRDVPTNISDHDVMGIAAWPGFETAAGRDAFVVTAKQHLQSQRRVIAETDTNDMLQSVAKVVRSVALPLIHVH